MRLRRNLRRCPFLLVAAAVIGFALRLGAANAQASDPGGQAALFDRRCAGCHAIPATRAPGRVSLGAMSPEFIVDALTNGLMKAQGSGLTPEERTALAEYLTGRKVGTEAPMAGQCAAASPPLSLDGPSFNGWGANVENWRFQSRPRPYSRRPSAARTQVGVRRARRDPHVRPADCRRWPGLHRRPERPCLRARHAAPAALTGTTAQSGACGPRSRSRASAGGLSLCSATASGTPIASTPRPAKRSGRSPPMTKAGR